MQTKPKETMVVLTYNSFLGVSYFCTDKKLKEEEKKNVIDLIVQLHDCHCSYKIDKALLRHPERIENIVHRTVINAKGHLC